MALKNRVSKIIGTEPAINYPFHTQVYYATHINPLSYSSSAEWLRESYMNRSFMSFSYGGKYIEDFNLLVTIENNRIQRAASAAFEDVKENYETLNGELYWGTHYLTPTFDLVLATDGMTQNQLDDFKHWFCGGVIRELIFAEHPNRAIMARVSAPPAISVLPFEYVTTIQVNGKTYETKTTLYKGGINLTLTSDEAFWHSKNTILGQRITKNGEEIWEDVWKDANEKVVTVYENQDALKIIKEDLVPATNMITDKTFVGSSIFIDIDYSIVNDKNGLQSRDSSTTVRNNGIAVAGADDDDVTLEEAVGFISDSLIDDSSSINNLNIRLEDTQHVSIYYPGTAPCYPVIEFSFKPVLNTSNLLVNAPEQAILRPFNSIYSCDGNSQEVITLESLKEQYFTFSLPSAYYGYNQALKLFKAYDNSSDVVELRRVVRENISHTYARSWAIAVIDSCVDSDNNLNFNATEALEKMQYFLYDDYDNPLKSIINIDSTNGNASGIIGYRKLDLNEISKNTDKLKNVNGWHAFGTINQQEEKVGDMILSDYFKIVERNHPNANGLIVPWSDEDDFSKTCSHKLTLNKNLNKNKIPLFELQDFSIDYKYFYY